MRIEADLSARVTWAMQQNAVPIVHELRLHHDGDEDLEDVLVQISTEPGIHAPWEVRIARIAAGGMHRLSRVDLSLRGGALRDLRERQLAELRVVVSTAKGLAHQVDGNERVAQVAFPVELLAWNEWPGTAAPLELLAAYVQPNHSALPFVLKRASTRLAEATGSGHLDAYQTKDPRRVRAIVEAIYESLRAMDLTYVEPPASFEQSGQKIRLADQVFTEEMGTCLDLALVFVACLEQVGLHALLIMMEGHVFPAVWLSDDTFADPVQFEPLRIIKRIELQEMLVVETTDLCGPPGMTFADAQEDAVHQLGRGATMMFALDLTPCRRVARILPLGVENHDARSGSGRDEGASTDGSTTEGSSPDDVPAGSVQERGASNFDDASPHAAESSVHLPGSTSATGAVDEVAIAATTPKGRLSHWASKLLDLSLRNRLLNARDTKKVLPLAVENLAKLEDALAGGRPFNFFPATKRAVGEETDDATSRQAARSAEHEDLKRRRLRVAVTDEELDKRLTQIQREARLSLSETGTNTLFLAVGFLEWFEAPGATQPRRAPLLLLPLEVSSSVARNTLQIELADDEARINTTLLEKLHADFGLPVEGLDVLPEDERGVDVDEVLLRFRRLIRDLDRWQIVPDAWVGFFAFTKLLMWRDLHHGSQTLLQSKLLRHLLLSPEDGFVHEGVSPDPVDLDAQFAPDAVFCPMDADSSQLAAVLAASSGRSFVLEGPPGTGKSQTITNLIAHTLAEGKRVLFVAEKRAALDVVQRRLAKVGLDPFCLVLHSGKGTKKHVVDQLGHTLDLGSIDEPKGWAGRADELEVVRRELNDYVLAIHRLRAPGFSMFEAVAEAAAIRDLANGEATKVQLQVDARGGPHGVSLLLDEATMREHGRLAARAGTASSRVAPMSEHAWRGVGLTTWAPALDSNAAAAVKRIADAVSAHREASPAGLKALFNQGSNDGGESSRQLIEWLEESGTEHAWSSVGDVADLMLRYPKLPAAFLHAPGFDERIEHVEALEGRLENLEVLRKEVAANFRETVFEEDLPGLRDTFVKHARSGCWGRFFGLRKSKRIVGGHAKVPLGEPMDVAKKLSRVEHYVALRDALDDMPEGAAELGALWQGASTDARSLDPVIRKAEALRGMLAMLVPCCDELATEDVLPDIAAVAERLAGGADATAVQRLKEVTEQLGTTVTGVAEELQIDVYLAWEHCPGPAHREALDIFVAETRAAPRGLRDLCAWNAVAAELEVAGLEPLAGALAAGTVHGDDAEQVFRRAYLEAWIPAVLNEESELASFRGLEHEDRIARFRSLDREVIDMAGDVVRARLAARLPRVGGGGDLRGSEVGTLRREQKKQRRHLPVRVLFEAIPNLLPRLAPCMLMSPMSVAQMLPLRDPDQKDARFDLVVFDEASQIPPWDAVGAIGRGTNVVVVGDSKQLPPTNFFQRMSGDGDEEEVVDTEIEDLESILDECSAAGLERMHLRWHYRSQHESLIAFSNHHYYEDLLYTFPSAAARMPGYGVSLRHIDGVYDRAKSQTNRAEADALVAEVVSRAKDPASRGLSLGIVTFSQAQQVLIEDLFDEARRKDRGLDEALSRLGPTEEPFFVKNLENVQGDERDVMLFSICYGPDANGRVFMNFGPVNRQGGERRLNVAVTRARRELVVFSSLRADQIDLSRTRALGGAAPEALSRLRGPRAGGAPRRGGSCGGRWRLRIAVREVGGTRVGSCRARGARAGWVLRVPH